MADSGKTAAGEERALLVDDNGALQVVSVAPAAAAMSASATPRTNTFGPEIGAMLASAQSLHDDQHASAKDMSRAALSLLIQLVESARN